MENTNEVRGVDHLHIIAGMLNGVRKNYFREGANVTVTVHADGTLFAFADADNGDWRKMLYSGHSTDDGATWQDNTKNVQAMYDDSSKEV